MLLACLKIGLDDKEEEALIEIMVSSCKQSSQGQGPPGRVVRKVRTHTLTVVIKGCVAVVQSPFTSGVSGSIAGLGITCQLVLFYILARTAMLRITARAQEKKTIWKCAYIIVSYCPKVSIITCYKHVLFFSS